ncbi:MAG: 3-oxoacyl-[acyl-carrier-protein] reductase FabG [Alphaproteobacteria bacterium MarineAlpha5_Bin12]|nr:hypothetical protein [Pelagibacteraceae bacterium]PPR41767.1 MAG: 3-oxoacyl-[acyl-carrier-protein] reductase FabG [Alphaproteobacteria bacterium MarineAlpha5_Bin12]|tara:strand:+ start:26922 stop:27662 length:741 start_codon:yes stop_codon:yes gene_type:complete
MFFNLKNQKVLITGSTGSIGSSIAKIFNECGATLICTSTSNKKLDDLKNIIGDKHYYFKLNLSDSNELDKSLDEIIKDHSDINILINNAGHNNDNLSIRMKKDEWDNIININLSSNFHIIKKIAPLMIKSRYGRIIGISSIIAITGNRGQSNYSASKSGMIGLYKSLALEYASRGITVNTIAPGFIESNMTKKLDQKIIENISNRIPLNKLGKPEDVAYVSLFLASKEAEYITGSTIHINGGMLMV